MIGQKAAVVQAILQVYPTFQLGQDNALLVLSADQLEQVKTMIVNDISNGTIEYSKNKTLYAEVRSYGRSMVMNHIKKAKELNGGNSYNPTSTSVSTTRLKGPKDGIDRSILPDYLANFVENL